MAQKDMRLSAVKVHGIVYRPGGMAPKPIDMQRGGSSVGSDGTVKSISLDARQVEICFKSGEQFVLAHMPMVACYEKTPPKEKTSGSVPVET